MKTTQYSAITFMKYIAEIQASKHLNCSFNIYFITNILKQNTIQ